MSEIKINEERADRLFEFIMSALQVEMDNPIHADTTPVDVMSALARVTGSLAPASISQGANPRDLAEFVLKNISRGSHDFTARLNEIRALVDIPLDDDAMRQKMREVAERDGVDISDERINELLELRRRVSAAQSSKAPPSFASAVDSIRGEAPNPLRGVDVGEVIKNATGDDRFSGEGYRADAVPVNGSPLFMNKPLEI